MVDLGQKKVNFCSPFSFLKLYEFYSKKKQSKLELLFIFKNKFDIYFASA